MKKKRKKDQQDNLVWGRPFFAKDRFAAGKSNQDQCWYKAGPGNDSEGIPAVGSYF